MHSPCASGIAWSAAIVALLLPATAARAEWQSPPVRLVLFGAVVRAQDAGFAVGAGGSGFLLAGPLELGLSATAETQVLGYSRVGLAAHLGPRAQLARVELEAAATAGIAWTRVGTDLWSDDPGRSGGIAFVGGRAGGSYALSVSDAGHQRASLGLIATYEHDVDPYDVTYSYEATPWLVFDGDTTPTARSSTVTLGTNRAALLLAVVLGFD